MFKYNGLSIRIDCGQLIVSESSPEAAGHGGHEIRGMGSCGSCAAVDP